MKKITLLICSSLVAFSGLSCAQQGGDDRPRRGGPGPRNLGESNAELGAAGVVWYPILEEGIAEAKRSNKPIFFMAVASQCHGISGVF